MLDELTRVESFTEGEDAQHLARELHLNSDADIAHVTDFMRVFENMLDREADGKLSETAVKSFINVLRFSTITANTASIDPNGDELESQYRYYNRGIIKDALVKIQGNFKTPYCIYQTKTNNNPHWQKYYAGGWHGITCSFGQVNIEFKIATDLQSRTSALSVWIYPDGKTDRKQFAQRLHAWGEQQSYGFRFLENDCGYWLCDKTVHADSREEIISYFATLIPQVTPEIEKILREEQQRT